MIKTCVCRSDEFGNTQGVEFQDNKYGKQQRVCNAMKKNSSGNVKYRCTVCEREHN